MAACEGKLFPLQHHVLFCPPFFRSWYQLWITPSLRTLSCALHSWSPSLLCHSPSNSISQVFTLLSTLPLQPLSFQANSLISGSFRPIIKYSRTLPMAQEQTGLYFPSGTSCITKVSVSSGDLTSWPTMVSTTLSSLMRLHKFRWRLQ